MKRKKKVNLILGVVYLILAMLTIRLGYGDRAVFILSTLVILVDGFINLTDSNK